jgi:hypothetical protein
MVDVDGVLRILRLPPVKIIMTNDDAARSGYGEHERSARI